MISVGGHRAACLCVAHIKLISFDDDLISHAKLWTVHRDCDRHKPSICVVVGSSDLDSESLPIRARIGRAHSRPSNLKNIPTMIRFVLSLFGVLFIQAALMGHLQSTSGDVFTAFGDGLRVAVRYDTGLLHHVTSIFTGSRVG